MLERLSDLILAAAARDPDAPALRLGDRTLTYGALAAETEALARAWMALDLRRGDRVGVYLDKSPETVVAMMAAAAAGCSFVPINPVLKAGQVEYILRHCAVRALVTSGQRLRALASSLADCPALKLLALTGDLDGELRELAPTGVELLTWEALIAAAPPSGRSGHGAIRSDVAAIFYTSGSTGMPKGVVLSHDNMIAGAQSVSYYLGNHREDRILSVLPLSFDAGFSQLTTAFNVGAEVVLLNYLLPRDVVRACGRYEITGLTGVPPLWAQLIELDWPEGAARSLRYFANTGGHMPRGTLEALRRRLPQAKPYLMYGLTEAFRSTYLDPDQVDARPNSMGKAIPNVEIAVVRPDGAPCDPGEAGELVHRGPLVSLGYWNDPEATAKKFRPWPIAEAGVPRPEVAVWSGDQVRRDEEGYLYFVGRNDEMIKTSGYRVSPTELESVIHASGQVGEVAALGVPHPTLGQAIVVVASAPAQGKLDGEALLGVCTRELPAFMVPKRIIEQTPLPRNANGKIDRAGLAKSLEDLFKEPAG